MYNFKVDNSWKSEIKEFAYLIKNNKKVVTGSLNDAVDIMKMIDQIYKSDIKWYRRFIKNK